MRVRGTRASRRHITKNTTVNITNGVRENVAAKIELRVNVSLDDAILINHRPTHTLVIKVLNVVERRDASKRDVVSGGNC